MLSAESLASFSRLPIKERRGFVRGFESVLGVVRTSDAFRKIVASFSRFRSVRLLGWLRTVSSPHSGWSAQAVLSTESWLRFRGCRIAEHRGLVGRVGVPVLEAVRIIESFR